MYFGKQSPQTLLLSAVKLSKSRTERIVFGELNVFSSEGIAAPGQFEKKMKVTRERERNVTLVLDEQK